MNTPDITRAEAQRLMKIYKSFADRYLDSVSDHFRRAGKAEAYHAALTPEEGQRFESYVRASFEGKTKREKDYATIKMMDVAVGIALSVGSSQDLAELFAAAVAFEPDDVLLLEKCDLPNITAVVKARLAL